MPAKPPVPRRTKPRLGQSAEDPMEQFFTLLAKNEDPLIRAWARKLIRGDKPAGKKPGRKAVYRG